MEEWERLPKGFKVTEQEDILRANIIRNAFIRGAAKIGAVFVELPSVGFEETFLKGINTVGDKAFSLEDKKGRKLLLSPDSTPHMVRWYLEKFPDRRGVKTFFQAPVFRYRNTTKRHWLQYGLASINEPYPCIDSSIDEGLLDIGRCYLEVLANQLELPVELKIGNIGLTKELLGRIGLTEKETDDFLNDLRKIDRSKWSQRICAIMPESDLRAALLELLDFKITSAMSSDPFINSPILFKTLRKEVEGTVELARLMVESTSVPFRVEFDDFHSSELLGGANFRLMIPGQAKHYGDGGCYTHYANKVTGDIESFKSIAGGLSHAFNLISTEHLKANLDVLVLSRNGSALLCRQIAEYLRGQTLNVRVMEQKGSLKGVLQRFSSGNPVVLIENGDRLRVLNQKTRETIHISDHGNPSCFPEILSGIS